VDVDDLEARIGARLDAGDLEGAITVALRGYGPQLLGYVYATVRDDAIAGDIFAMACEDMWKGIAAFRRESSFRTWAYQVTWHAASRFLRDPFRHRAQLLATGQASELAAEVRSTTALHLKTSSKDALDEIRAELSPEERTLLILRVDRDLSWPEIACVVDEPEATLRKRFQRLTERLRERVRERGLL
jgi:RNA polymerase sigma-70 factor (ECF subfamily)